MLIRSQKENSGGGGLPLWMNYVDVTITEDNKTAVTIPYDNTKTPLMMYFYLTNPNALTARRTISNDSRFNYNGGYWHFGTITGTSSTSTQQNGSYGAVTLDDTNGTITFAPRDSYPYIVGETYRAVILYEEGA